MRVLLRSLQMRLTASDRATSLSLLANLALRVQMKPEDAARLTALKKEIAAGEAELAKLKQSAAGLLAQADKLQEQLDNVGGPKMKKQKQAVADLQQVRHAIICVGMLAAQHGGFEDPPATRRSICCSALPNTCQRSYYF